MRALALLAAATLGTAAFAQAPDQVVFQGRLVRTDGQPETTAQTLTFSIFAAPTGGTALWTETHPGVQLNNGYYVVTLGTTNPLSAIFDGQVRYLSVSLPGQSELLPRMAIASVPYSISAGAASYAATAGSAMTATNAADSALLGGMGPGAFAPASHVGDLASPTSPGHLSAADKDKLDKVPTVWGNGLNNSGTDGGVYRVDVAYAGSGGTAGTSQSVARADHSHALPKLSCSRVTTAGSAQAGATATCPTGEELTGGGCEDMPSGTGVVSFAAPNTSNGFFCQATGGSVTSTTPITAHGVCCKLVP